MAFCTREAFSGVHVPFTSCWTGAVDTSVVKVPSGFAVIVVVGVLSAVATTGWPVDSACSCACSSVTSAAACAAGARTGAAATPVARAAASKTLDAMRRPRDRGPALKCIFRGDT